MSEEPSLVEQVDELQRSIAANADRFVPVATIDHSRLAGEAGVEMPPCVVTIFSDPAS
jgi:hypothetical protein